jgi:hypothetical protein
MRARCWDWVSAWPPGQVPWARQETHVTRVEALLVDRTRQGEDAPARCTGDRRPGSHRAGLNGDGLMVEAAANSVGGPGRSEVSIQQADMVRSRVAGARAGTMQRRATTGR